MTNDSAYATIGDPRLPQRFWAKVNVAPSGCWLWTGAPAGRGYAQTKWHGRQVLVHRLAYKVLVGPVSDDLVIDHLCRVRNCVNPAHLEPVTHQVNLLRGETLAAENSQKTHCANGHEFTPENTRLDRRKAASGDRYIRACRACALARYHARRLAS